MRFSRILCIKVGIIISLSAFISACGVKNMYEWNDYNNHLLSYYKHPEELDKFSKKLYEGIEKAEETNNVPPGIYAEYGYVMLTLNDPATASLYFAKERDKWSESKFLMDKALQKIAKISPQNIAKNPTTNSIEGEKE